MNHISGPNLPTDDKGRVVAHGYAFTGDDSTGYRGRAVVPPTASEVAHGVKDLIFGESLFDVLVEARAMQILRSGIGTTPATLESDNATRSKETHHQ